MHADENRALIFDIKHYAVHDGPGIRTTVFFKGCPLRCRWCHNPEGISTAPEIQYAREKCIACGSCAAVCPAGAHRITPEGHVFDREKCSACGKCVDACPTEALMAAGRYLSLSEVLSEVLQDRAFYENSGGGVTLSGGECLMQAQFCAELLKRLKEEGIHTAVDTSGSVSRQAIERVAAYTDLFLYDVKHIDSCEHRRFTGLGNEAILDNLRLLGEMKKNIEIRIPVIPGVNNHAQTIHAIGRLLSEIETVICVKILKYNNLAGSKYSMLARENTMPPVDPPSDGDMDACRQILEAYRLNVVQ